MLVPSGKYRGHNVMCPTCGAEPASIVVGPDDWTDVNCDGCGRRGSPEEFYAGSCPQSDRLVRDVIARFERREAAIAKGREAYLDEEARRQAALEDGRR